MNNSWVFLLLTALFCVALGEPTLDDSDDSASKTNLPIVSTVEGRLMFPRDNEAKLSGRVIVNGGERIVFISPDGTFSVPNLVPGSHVLDFSVGDYIFQQVRVDVHKKKRGKVRTGLTVDVRGERTDLGHPLLLEPIGRSQYFVPRDTYNPLNMLKNPMIIMALISMVFLFIMPQDQMKEMQKEMFSGQDPPKNIWDMVKKLNEPPKQEQVTANPQSNN